MFASALECIASGISTMQWVGVMHHAWCALCEALCRQAHGSWLMHTIKRSHNAFMSVHNSTVELLAYQGMWKYLVMALFLLNLRQTYR